MIVIVTKNENNELISNEDLLIIKEKVKAIDEFHLLLNNQIIEFTYLIFDDLSLIDSFTKLNILIDDEPVTNYYGETSSDYIFYGNVLSCLNYLRNGD